MLREVQKLRLLLVEDNPGDRSDIRQMLGNLKNRDWHLAEAWNLAEALRPLKSNSVDLVLLDLNLPDSRGMETLTTVRSATPGIPIIVVSGHDDRETAIEALHRGAQDYLVKGHFDGHLLSRAIARLTERLLPKGDLKRSLQPMMEGDLVVGWTCTGCSWWYRVEKPVRRGDHKEEEQVARLFSAHECERFRMPSQSSTTA